MTIALQCAVARFTERGVTVERLAENGAAYRPYDRSAGCIETKIPAKRTQPHRPRADKIERFHRTPGNGWAHARFDQSTEQRNPALPAWLHFYDHRAHSSIGGRRPVIH